MDERTALPERVGRPDPAHGLEAGSALPGVDRHRDRGLDLTPEELVARRRNRRWMLGIAIPSIIVLALALIATGVFWSNEPSGPKITAPAGYRAVSDGYFAYAVPRAWSTNPAFTDDAGDIDTSGPSGWAGENRSYRFAAPTLGGTPPSSLRAFGMPRPAPFQLTDGHTLTVNGAAVAFAYTAIRPGGFHATVVDAWNARSGVELWLMVYADAPVTAQILGSLQAGG